MSQEEILTEILSIYREIESNQEKINELVIKNREKIKEDKDFEEDYTKSIESYYWR